MDFTHELEKVDFQDLFDRLAAYAGYKLYGVDIRLLDGREPADLVSDLFVKVFTGQRNAETAHCTLEEFLFGCLSSDIDAFFRKNKIRHLPVTEELTEMNATDPRLEFSDRETKERIISELRKAGADDDEIKVFNIWTEGITKPQKVGTHLNLEASEIYRIQRRIQSRLLKIQKSIKTLV